jgi:hypothetical protein
MIILLFDVAVEVFGGIVRREGSFSGAAAARIAD